MAETIARPGIVVNASLGRREAHTNALSPSPVTVIDVVAGAARLHATVIINGDRIVAVSDDRDALDLMLRDAESR